MEMENEAYERHRPFFREINGRFSSVYGYGGSSIGIVGLVVPLLGGYKYSLLGEPVLYAGVFLLVCLGFYLLRGVVRSRRTVLRETFEAYCRVNDLEVDALVAEVRVEESYPYVAALFEEARPQLTSGPN